MINGKQINTNYQQNGKTCVLSSYAIVNNFYTKIPIDDIFRDYCKHFNLQDKINTSTRYDKHFHTYIDSKKITGYDCITDLHNNSRFNSFKNSRKIFKIIQYDSATKNSNEIENILINNEALLNLTFQHSQGHHSITVYLDENDNLFKVRDTEMKILYTGTKFEDIINIITLENAIKVCDANLYDKI